MTREDMLDCLHYELENLRVARGSDYSGVEAIEMAINALEAQEKAQKVSNNSSELDNNFGELISRQAANYKICNACGMIDCDQMDKCKKVFTAQPEKCTETHSCDLISRKMVLALPRNKVRSLRTYEVVEETINVTDIEHLPSAQPEPIRINLNELIKVKLTDWGKEIYYHQYDRTNQIAGREICKPRFPREDENGYTEFQLWCFIELYGMHMGMTLPNVIEPLEIVYER